MPIVKVLTIGTEITSGEIVNTNASWISLELEKLGARVDSHLTVRDQFNEIIDALKWCSGKSILVITGGLGPTSDDITRDCVAEFFKSPLQFNAHYWHELTELLNARQVTVREDHKKQCYFPETSEILKNPVGTAHGFYLYKNEQHIFVLPGPPRELQGMWQAEVRTRLSRIIPPNAYRWYRWTCQNVPESEVAAVVEPVIKGAQLEVGYRAKKPYIRVKLYANPIEHGSIIENVEKAIQKWLCAEPES